MPLLGPLWQWSAAASFARILAMLVEQGVPLGEALRLTGSGLADSAVKEACYAMSFAVEDGRIFPAAASVRPFPRRSSR